MNAADDISRSTSRSSKSGTERRESSTTGRPYSSRRKSNRAASFYQDGYSSSPQYSSPIETNSINHNQPNNEEYTDDFIGGDTYTKPDLTPVYTKSIVSQISVAVCSGICISILSTIFMKMVLNYSNTLVVTVSSILFALSSFHKGEIAELSKALGVFFILLLRPSQLTGGMLKIAEQIKAACLLSIRKPFPPSENPWSYVYDPNVPESIQFKMTNCLMGIIFGGAFCGWTIARSIPLFPTWLGALLLASCCGYLGTIRDSRGDLLRFVSPLYRPFTSLQSIPKSPCFFHMNRCIGYSIQSMISYMQSKAQDVNLGEKATVVFTKVFAILLRIEKQYDIKAKVSVILKAFIDAISSLLRR